MSNSNVVRMTSNSRLSKIAADVRRWTTESTNDVWLVAEGMAEAKDVCEEDGESWKDWVEEAAGYSTTQADDYVRICLKLAASGGELARKGCNFNTLKALAAESLPKADKKKLLDRLRKKDYITQKDCSKIQADVREALPTVGRLAAPVLIRKDAFAERLDYADQFDVSAEWLFDLPKDYCPETASLVVKHWKQKYHPDRGGNKYMFALLTEKAEQLEVK